MYHYGFELVEVIDGDTIKAIVDCGFTVKVEVTFRLTGINAPEKKMSTRAAGYAAKDYLTDLLTQQVERLELHSEKSPNTEKYGRWLAHIFVFRGGELAPLDVNAAMIDAGHAVPFMVGK